MTQRPDLFQLERNHPLAKGLVFAGLGSNPGGMTMLDASAHKNHGTLTNMTPSTDWVFVPELGRWGIGPLGVGYVAFNLGPFTSGTFACWFGSDTTGSTYQGLLAFSNDVTHIRLSTADAGTRVYVLSGAYPANTLYHLCVTWNATSYSSYANGTQIASNVADTAWTSKVFKMLGCIQYSAADTYHPIVDPVFYNRALTPNEIADLADPSNVYLSGLIAGRPRRRWVFLGGGSTVEINATLASLELTGNAAGVSVGTTVGASAGAVELSGIAASVSSGTDVAATTASTEATGLDATVSVGTDIAAGVGNLNATAQATSVSVGTTFTAGAGAIEASGLKATVSTGDSIDATTAAVGLSGASASVSVGTTFSASTGAVTLGGLAADVSVGTTITGSLATLVAAALAADVSAAVAIEASTAAMEWSSPLVSVSTGGRIKRPHLLHGGRLSHDWGIKTGGAL